MNKGKKKEVKDWPIQNRNEAHTNSKKVELLEQNAGGIED